jgi:nucleoid-associated protein YgaU
MSTTTIRVAGANLFRLAAVYLGDASQWNRIAALNGLTDFQIEGALTLRIPPLDKSAGNGGVLGV